MSNEQICFPRQETKMKRSAISPTILRNEDNEKPEQNSQPNQEPFGDLPRDILELISCCDHRSLTAPYKRQNRIEDRIESHPSKDRISTESKDKRIQLDVQEGGIKLYFSNRVSLDSIGDDLLQSYGGYKRFKPDPNSELSKASELEPDEKFLSKFQIPVADKKLNVPSMKPNNYASTNYKIILQLSNHKYKAGSVMDHLMVCIICLMKTMKVSNNSILHCSRLNFWKHFLSSSCLLKAVILSYNLIFLHFCIRLAKVSKLKKDNAFSIEDILFVKAFLLKTFGFRKNWKIIKNDDQTYTIDYKTSTDIRSFENSLSLLTISSHHNTLECRSMSIIMNKCQKTPMHQLNENMQTDNKNRNYILHISSNKHLKIPIFIKPDNSSGCTSLLYKNSHAFIYMQHRVTHKKDNISEKLNASYTFSAVDNLADEPDGEIVQKEINGNHRNAIVPNETSLKNIYTKIIQIIILLVAHIRFRKLRNGNMSKIANHGSSMSRLVNHRDSSLNLQSIEKSKPTLTSSNIDNLTEPSNFNAANNYNQPNILNPSNHASIEVKKFTPDVQSHQASNQTLVEEKKSTIDVQSVDSNNRSTDEAFPLRVCNQTHVEEKQSTPYSQIHRVRRRKCASLSVVFCLFLVATVLLTPAVSAEAGSPDAKRLYDDLLSNYNKLVRPVKNVTNVLTVLIKLKLSQLIDVVSTH